MVSRKNPTPVVQRLLSEVRKYTTDKTRLASRRKKKRKTIKLSSADKALAAAKRKTERLKYSQALTNARKVVMDEATKLHEVFGAHTTEYYYEQLLQGHRLSRSKREVNRWNIWLRKEVQRINDALPEGESRKKSAELTSGLAVTWRAMTMEEKIAATEDGIEELREVREVKRLSKQNIPLHAFNDARATLESVADTLQALHSRTGTEVVLMAVRGSINHYLPPYTSITSTRCRDFFNLACKEPLNDIAVRFEAFTLSGVQGVSNNYVKSFLEMKSSLATQILELLRSAATTRVPRMYYKNFDNNITAKYGVVLNGWPLKKFQNPSEIASRTELQVLKNSLESGATYFKKLTVSELAEWEEARLQSQLDPEDTIGPTDSPDTSSPSNPIGDETTGPSITQPTSTNNSTSSNNPITDNSSHPDPVAPAGASERPLPGTQRVGKRARDGFINLGHGVTGVDGTTIIVVKKPRKARSDKGRKRGSRS